MHWQRFHVPPTCTWVFLLLLLIQQAPATILDAPAVAVADQHRQLEGEKPGLKRALLSYPDIAQRLNLTVPQVQDLAIYLSNYAWPLNQDRPLTPDQLSAFLSQDKVKIVKPPEGGVWVSSEDVKIGNDSGLVLSAYFHPTKVHAAYIAHQRNATQKQCSTAIDRGGQWAYLAETRRNVTGYGNKPLYEVDSNASLPGQAIVENKLSCSEKMEQDMQATARNAAATSSCGCVGMLLAAVAAVYLAGCMYG